LGPFVRGFVFFAPLPVLERVPIGVVFVSGGLLASRLLRFARRGLFVRASFVTRLLLPPLLALVGSTRRFALGRFRASGRLLVGRFGFRLSHAAERGLEVEVGPEIVLGGGRRRPRALRTGRASRTTLGPSRFVPLRSRGFFLLGSGPRGLCGRWSGSLRLGGRRSRLVEQQILGRNLGVGRRAGSQVDSEQIFGQGLPRIFLAARAGAQWIGVHKALITIVKRTRGQSLRRKAAKTAAQGKH
jgi:hypothetical protein